MTKSGAVWQIPVSSPSTRATKRLHTALTATTSAPATTTPSSTTRSVESMHEVLCCAGATATLRYYYYYKGTGFGNASKTDIRNFKCPIKPLMHGEATPKRRATSSSDTMEVRAHAAHLDDADIFCACCADEPPERVQWPTGPWDVLRGQSQQPPGLPRNTPTASYRSVPKNIIKDPNKDALDNGPSGDRHVATGERTATASAKPPAQGEQAQGEPAQGEHVQRETSSTWSVLPARYSKVFRKAAGILKHHVAPHDQ